MRNIMTIVVAGMVLTGCGSSKWLDASESLVYVEDIQMRVDHIGSGVDQFDVRARRAPSGWFGYYSGDRAVDYARAQKAIEMVLLTQCRPGFTPAQMSLEREPDQPLYVGRYKCVAPSSNQTTQGGQVQPQPINVTVNANPVITVHSPPPLILDPLGMAAPPLPAGKAAPASKVAGSSEGPSVEAPKEQ